jgi:hypothetical protein
VRKGTQKGVLKWVFAKWGQTDVDYRCRDREWASISPTGCDEKPTTAILNMPQRFLQPALIRPGAYVKDQK